MIGRSGFLLLVFLNGVWSGPRGPAEPALTRALHWLASQQQADGGFSNGFSPVSDPGTTADVVLGIVAAGQDPQAWSSAGKTPLDFLEATAASGLGGNAGLTAKMALAVSAAGLNPRRFGGRNLLAQIQRQMDVSTGLFGSGPFDSSLAILALAATGGNLPAGAVEGLLRSRLEDGSFSFSGDRTAGAGDSNTTALAIQALWAAGEQQEIAPSLEYLRRLQNEDGGWTYQKPSPFGEETDANSTALAIEALASVGEDLADWGNAVPALLALQRASGAFAFNADTSGNNLLATVQALPALAAARGFVPPSPPTATASLAPASTSTPTPLPVQPPPTPASAAPVGGGAGGGIGVAALALVIALGLGWWIGRQTPEGRRPT